MKYLLKLPDSSNFLPIASENDYRWRDKDSSLIQIRSEIANPFKGEVPVLIRIARGKGDQSLYSSGLIIKVFASHGKEERTQAILIREKFKAKFAHSLEPPLFFAAFSIDEMNWLIYSILDKNSL